MTLQQLKYIIQVSESESLTQASQKLYISQPTLSMAIQDVERELGITIFRRGRRGIALTPDGAEFIAYARQVLQQMELLQDRFSRQKGRRSRLVISSHHYTFTANAFARMIRDFPGKEYEFILNETQTVQIIRDVRSHFSDLGILYISSGNSSVIRGQLHSSRLSFHELVRVRPHVFLSRDHPLAGRTSLTFQDLQPYPRLNYLQGRYASAYFAEEMFSSRYCAKQIRASDQAVLLKAMLAADGYMISSGISKDDPYFSQITAVPLQTEEEMSIGYVLDEKTAPAELTETFIKYLQEEIAQRS